MSRTKEVIIDGVRYIPYTEKIADQKVFLKALLAQYWGFVKDEDILEKMEDLKIVVTDDNCLGGISFDKLICEIERLSNE